jgi:hypothetical protein
MNLLGSEHINRANYQDFIHYTFGNQIIQY